MTPVVVVFPRPLAARQHREFLPSKDVIILALHGPATVGWAEGRTALVVDEHGNLEWEDTDGLEITNAFIRDALTPTEPDQ